MKDFGTWLHAQRVACGVSTVTELRRLIHESAGIDLSRTAVWKWENNTSRPTKQHLVVLLDVLRVPEALHSQVGAALAGWGDYPGVAVGPEVAP